MKNFIIILLAGLFAWYFLFKGKRKDATSAGTTKSKNSDFDLKKDVLTQPEASLVNVAETMRSNIENLTSDTGVIVPRSKEEQDVIDMQNGKAWEEGMFNPYGGMLPPAVIEFLRHRYLPLCYHMAKYNTLVSGGIKDQLLDDMRRTTSNYYYAVTLLESYIKQAEQYASNPAYNFNPYSDSEGNPINTFPVEIPDALKGFVPMFNRETASPNENFPNYLLA